MEQDQLPEQNQLHHCATALQRANQIALAANAQELPSRMLALLAEATGVQLVLLYRYDASQDTLHLSSAQGRPQGIQMAHKLLASQQSSLRAVLHMGHTLALPSIVGHAEWEQMCHAVPDLDSLYCLPLRVGRATQAVLACYGLPAYLLTDTRTGPPLGDGPLALLHMLADRLAVELERNHQIEAQHQLLASSLRREQRLEALVDFIPQITTTLKRNELVQLIMSHAEQLLDVEATSFWLLDERDGRVHLLVSAGDTKDMMSGTSVALGEGIIGYVTQTGERKVVNDVRTEPLFTPRIDLESGFVTRSVISVPMRAPRIHRGDLRGEIEEAIIGGAQALNKRDGTPFNADDLRCFETLARQAATAFQFSRLFEEDYTLFWGVIKATTSAIDFTDPYARGHSARVADFSVAIAEELGLSQHEIYRVRVGSMLHDIGKIGVSEQVLRKPARLTEEEHNEIKRHPTYGVELLTEAGLSKLLGEELLALAQHHERLDGAGYPAGLKGEEISRIARIVGVADTFDALTSDRPYRSALSLETAFGILEEIAGSELDAECVAALMRARQHGKIKMQCEREDGI